MTEYYLEATDVDDSSWIALPTVWPLPGFEDVFPDAVPWSRAAAGTHWEESGLTPEPGEVEALARTLTYCAEILPDRRPGFEVFLHLPSPRDVPLAVYVGDYESDGADVDVREALGLGEAGAVEAPLVDEVVVPTLGAGRRALRYAKDDDGGVIASLRYAWYVEAHGMLASVITAADPARVVAAAGDVDRLCRGLRYLPEDAFPA